MSPRQFNGFPSRKYNIDRYTVYNLQCHGNTVANWYGITPTYKTKILLQLIMDVI